LRAGDIESNAIFRESIVGSSDSYLSALIQQLGHSDWIKQSYKFVDKDDEQCPYCQQALQADFYSELEKVFDKTYELRIAELASLQTRYKNDAEQLVRTLDESPYQVESFLVAALKLKSAVQQNVVLINAKVANPSTPVDLLATASLVADLNAAIKVEQDRIDAINLKIKDKLTYLDQIKNRTWNCLRGSCDVLIKEATEEHRKVEKTLEEKRDAIRIIKGQIRTHQDAIVASRAKITNVDQAVDSINRWLRVLGLQGFELKREEGEVPQYRLHRPEQKDDVFKTLSEGEKTLISFLYFLEVCNGDLDVQAGKLKSDRIIVIDDPISSLSHNYIYDIASLIRQEVLTPKNRFKQVFILTHNLFFFHEMIKQIDREREDEEVKKDRPFALFRITKAQFSQVTPMQVKDVQNDYQAFWQTLKDALENRASSHVVPNMMRNILEHYFGFVHQRDRLSIALQQLTAENPEYRSLYRYVNRESHSDPINITDFGDIDPTHYLARFRDVFVKTGYQAHFEKMMS
jgi:wobble nucleotide-excising tRNase